MNTLLFRSGQVQLARIRVEAASAIQPGDLLYLDAGVARPAAEFPWQEDVDSTRAAFAAAFVGIAYSPSATGETAPVSVDLGPFSVYEAPTTAAAFEVGDLLAPAAVGETLSRSTLARVTDPAQAVARAAEYTAAGAVSVRAAFATAYHPASANVNAAVG